MSDEHTVAIVSFEGAIKRAVKGLRQRLLPAADKGLLPSNEFRMEIKAQGRIQDGEIKIEFILCRDIYGSDPVKGNSLEAVTEEYLRRAGWQAVNAPIAISFTKVTPAPVPGNPPEDEIPF